MEKDLKRPGGVVRGGLLLFSVLLGAFVFMIVFGTYLPDMRLYFEQRKMDKLQEETERVQAEIRRAYQNDFDGGKTPEETFDLFIAALKAGDALKASKYYELSVQDKAFENLKKELDENGNFKDTISYFTLVVKNGKRTCVDVEKESGGCAFEYEYVTIEDRESKIVGTDQVIFVPKGSTRTKIADFSLNQNTNIWKLDQPY